MIPNNDVVKVMKIMEQVFYEMHGAFLSDEKYLFKALTAKTISRLQDVALREEVIFHMAKTRTYIRLKSINKKISFTNCKRRLERKMSKFTNRK